MIVTLYSCNLFFFLGLLLISSHAFCVCSSGNSCLSKDFGKGVVLTQCYHAEICSHAFHALSGLGITCTSPWLMLVLPNPTVSQELQHWAHLYPLLPWHPLTASAARNPFPLPPPPLKGPCMTPAWSCPLPLWFGGCSPPAWLSPVHVSLSTAGARERPKLTLLRLWQPLGPDPWFD